MHTKRKPTTRPKATITERRLHLRTLTWDVVKSLLQHHLAEAKGNQHRMAKALGLEDSQLHRYSCPVCEHNQEPFFSTGVAILAYLQIQINHPVLDNLIEATDINKP